MRINIGEHARNGPWRTCELFAYNTRSELSAPTSRPAKSTRMDFSTFHSKYCTSNHRLFSLYSRFYWSSDSNNDRNSRSTRAGVVPRIKTFSCDSRARRAMPLRNYVTWLLLKYPQTEEKEQKRVGSAQEGRVRRRSRETDETVNDWRRYRVRHR